METVENWELAEWSMGCLEEAEGRQWSAIEVQQQQQARRRKRKREDELKATTTTTIRFQENENEEGDGEAIQQMKEMIYRAAAFRPVNLGMEEEEEAIQPRRKNVRISSDPQTVAARQRRERISHRLRLLQKLVPGGTKMDTASMLDEAANYLKFLTSQLTALQQPLQPNSFNFSNSFPYYPNNLLF